MAYSHVILNNIEWGEGGKRTFIWRGFPFFFFRITGKNVFFEMCLKVVLYKKKASFLRNCPKMFFARFDIFNDLLFIQHNFFVSI